MKTILFCIRDAKAVNYGPPFCKGARGEAERDFTTLANDEQSQLSKYPEDFDLFEIGEYDTNTGKLTSLDTPKHMMKAVDVVRQK